MSKKMPNIFECKECGACRCVVEIIGTTANHTKPDICPWGTEHPVKFKVKKDAKKSWNVRAVGWRCPRCKSLIKNKTRYCCCGMETEKAKWKRIYVMKKERQHSN